MSESGMTFADLLGNPYLLSAIGVIAAVKMSADGASSASGPAGTYALSGMRTSSARCNDSGSVFRFRTLLCFVPIVFAGVLAIYGAIIAVIIAKSMSDDNLSARKGFCNMCAGFVVGGSCSSSGYATSSVLYRTISPSASKPLEDTKTCSAKDDPTTPQSVHHPLLGGITDNGERQLSLADVAGRKPDWNLFVVLSFIEAVGLYGLIIALILTGIETA